MRLALALFCLSLAIPVSAQSTAPPSDLPALMPRDLEVDLALSALPEHLRAEASVLVLQRGGLVSARDGSNGFVCLVRRMGSVPGDFIDSVIPICYDAEGARTLVPAVREEIRLLESGMASPDVRARIASEWERGVFNVPGPGISYMLSSVVDIRTPGNPPRTFVPHLMFYGPYKSGDDVGANEDPFDPVPFIQAAGLPSAMMVVPLGEEERAAIAAEQEGLARRVEAWRRSLAR